MLSPVIEAKLKDLPKNPGVYFHKDARGEIIYVGKAAVLNSRVRQYFQKSRNRDPKTDSLVAEIADFDWMVVDSEMEALFLEAEMIRRYMPRFNILLRDDKSLSFIRIDYASDFPTVSLTRRPLDDGAKYFGPFLSALSVRQALRGLRRVFPYATHRIPGQKRATLQYHLGLDPGLEDGRTTLRDYRANLRKLMAVIQGKTKSVENDLEAEMKQLAKAAEFEKAAKIRNQLFALRNLNRQIIFSDKEFLDISKDHALNELVNLLGLSQFPRRIEGYDISHMSGSDVVASMVVFSNGVSDKGQYRKFKMKLQVNNDFLNMHATITRRFGDKNMKLWSKPNLVIIDGGKGQLESAIRARNAMGYENIPFMGLAKREEQIVLMKDTKIPGSKLTLDNQTLQKLGGFYSESNDFIVINLPHNTNLIKLLQRIRDESHRFAVSYHSVLKRKRQTNSVLEDIPGVGSATKKKLLRHFGSLKSITVADPAELALIVGQKKAHVISETLSFESGKTTP